MPSSPAASRDAPDIGGTGFMAGEPGQSAARGPATVAIHDDGNMRWYVFDWRRWNEERGIARVLANRCHRS